MKILVAEDDAVSAKLLEMSLKQWGHQPFLASDGAKALEMWRMGGFDAVITDWMMPELDGLDLTRRIRERERDGYTWIIMLTTKNFRDNYAAAMQAGVDDFLTKPLDRELLRVRLGVGARVVGAKKQLSEMVKMLPICMHCKSVRDGGTSWQRIEEYLAREAKAELSHGYCPDCFYIHDLKPALERYAANNPPPPASLAGGFDAAWVAWLLASDPVAPGLSQDLFTAFHQLIGSIRAGLSSLNGAPSRTEAAAFAIFAARAGDVGARQLAHALERVATDGVAAPALDALAQTEASLAALGVVPGLEPVADLPMPSASHWKEGRA